MSEDCKTILDSINFRIDENGNLTADFNFPAEAQEMVNDLAEGIKLAGIMRGSPLEFDEIYTFVCAAIEITMLKAGISKYSVPFAAFCQLALEVYPALQARIAHVREITEDY